MKRFAGFVWPLLGFLGVIAIHQLSNRPPKVGHCYESKFLDRSAPLYMIEKVVTVNDHAVTTVYTFPNDDSFPKGKWATSIGELNSMPLYLFIEDNREVTCPW